MKKLLLVAFFLLFLSACAEQKQYEQALLAKIEADPDVKDYHIDPEVMTRCMMDLTSKKMPGIISIDPRRGPYYIGYGKLISVTSSKDPQKTLQEIQEIFGSADEIRKALSNYAEAEMECMTSLVSKSEESLVEGS